MRAGDDHDGAGAAFARAALAGNPSDGYGGGVLAVCVRNFAATVELTRAGDGLRVRPAAAGALVEAAVARHATATGRVPPALSVTVRTTIPREVGLAGSSAIVIATMRALDALLGTRVARDALPPLALAAETDLGIAAGLQDRVAQAYGGLTAMTFDSQGFAARALDPGLLPPLIVAWDTEGAEPSGRYHGDLRARWAAGEPRVRSAIARLAEAARSAAAAIERRDAAALGAAMDASYDLRASLGPLDPRHVALVQGARDIGLCANYAGSGGAIVAISPDAAPVAALLDVLADRSITAVEARVVPAGVVDR